MQVQAFNLEEDMDQIRSWWHDHGEMIDVEDFLSDKGFIVPGVCASWLYIDGPLAFIAWTVANPYASPKDVYEGIKVMVQDMRDYAHDEGAKVAMTFTNVSGILKVLKRVGFVEATTGGTSLVSGV